MASAESIAETSPSADIYFTYVVDKATKSIGVSKASTKISGPTLGIFFLNVYFVLSNIPLDPGASGGGMYANVGGDIKYIGVITGGNIGLESGEQVLQFVGI